MNKQAQLIKAALMMELAKEGKTLNDFEKELATVSQEKRADTSTSGKLFDALGHLVNLGGISAMLTGGAVGLGGYMGYRANEDSTELKLKKLREQQQYLEAARLLQIKMQNQPTV